MPELTIALETIVSEARCDLGHDSGFRPKKVCRKAPVSQGWCHRGSAQAIEGNFVIISTHLKWVTRWPITIEYNSSTWFNRKFLNLGTHRFLKIFIKFTLLPNRLRETWHKFYVQFLKILYGNVRIFMHICGKFLTSFWQIAQIS